MFVQDSFSQDSGSAHYDNEDVCYRLPDPARAARQSPWQLA